MAAGDVLLRERGVFPVYRTDLTTIFSSNTNIINPPYPEATLSFIYDAFGYRLFTYRNNQNGATLTSGGLYSRKKLIVTNLDSGTTLSATKAATFGTSPLYVGALMVVHDDAGAAGAAPEGEYSIVASHTAATLTFDSALPLTVALAVNDDITVISPKVVAAADGDFQAIVAGVAMAAVTSTDWGWFQCHGLHPRVAHKAAGALVAGDPVVADVATVGPFGTDAANLWVGFNEHTYAADVASNLGPIVMALMPAYI